MINDPYKMIFLADNYPNLKAFFQTNDIKEKCVYFVLNENMYETIMNEVVIKRLSMTSFSIIDATNYILSLPKQTESIYGIKGYLKKIKLFYQGDNFIIMDFKPLANEYYSANDLLDKLEMYHKSIINN